MKKAIVFYSVSGQTEYVANLIARMTTADKLKIETAEQSKGGLFARYTYCLKQMRSESVKLKDSDIDLNEYDTIYFGSPVWKSSPTKAVIEFLRRQKLANKRIYLFCTESLCGGKKCLDRLSAELSGNEIASKAVFRNPKRMDNLKLKKKLIEFLIIE